MTREGRSQAALRRGRALGALCIAVLALAAPAHAAPGWTPKETLPDTNLSGFGSTVVTAADGTTAVIFTQTQNGHSAVVAAERPPGGRLGAPQTLSKAPDDECTAPAVAVNRRGDLVVVWQRKTGTTNRVEAAFRPAGGAWQTPVPVADDTDTTDMTPQVAIAPSGEAIAVWRHYTGTRDVIRATRRPAAGSGWLNPPENISAVGTTPSAPQVEVADSGTFTAAWKETSTPQGVTTKGVRAATLPAGGAWTLDAGAPLAVDSFSFDLAVGSTGRVAIAYPGFFPQENLAVKAIVRDPGGTWSAPAYVGVESGYMDPVHAAIDDQGVVSISFVSTGGNEIRASRLVLPNPWSTPFDLARGTFADTYHPVVASGAAGRSIAAWRGDNGRGLNQVQASTVTGAGDWSVPQDLDTGGSPEVAVDGLGNGVVIWFSTAGLNLAAHDISPPDLLAVDAPSTATRGSEAAFAVNARDRWSALQSITWDFGDGQTATGAAPAHTYAASGTYPVKVTATDVLGNASTAERTVTVQDPPPPPVDPTPTPQPGSPTPTPKPPAKKKASKPATITVTVRSGFGLPARVSPKVACGSRVGLTLRRKKTVLARESAKLSRKGRSCRFEAKFTFKRSKVGSTRTLRCTVRYRETKALGGRTWNITVKVTG